MLSELGDLKTRRTISFANSEVAVDFIGQDLSELVEFLFRFLPHSDAEQPQIRFALERDEVGAYHLLCEGALLYKNEDIVLVADRLLGELSYQLAYRNHSGLMVHSAAVAWHGHGILLPGASGAGKSTLTSWLLSREFTYLTDELVFIPQGSTTINSFTRPLNLKKPSRKVIGGLIDYESQPNQIRSSSCSDLVAPGLLGGSIPSNSACLRTIIFPRFQQGIQFGWCKLTQAQAGLELMKCVINARNLQSHGLDQVSYVVRNVDAYQMTYGHFDQLIEQISWIHEDSQ